jgi:ribonuclease HI
LKQIRDEIRKLENDNWDIRFTWVKPHNGSYGNELADQLAKDAASRNEVRQLYDSYSFIRKLKLRTR